MIKKNDNYLTYFILIAIGLLLISIVFPFVVNYFFSNWIKSGSFGDTFGGLSALFSGLALAGVIVTVLIQKTELQNQQIELKLQRIEMQETRKEFFLNRATNILYNQLNRFENNISNLTIIIDGQKYIGYNAVSFLDKQKETVAKPIDKSEEVYRTEIKDSIIHLVKLYTPNKSEFEKFANNAYNSVEALKRIIYKSNLEPHELNDLKNLFFDNIGFVTMGIIEYFTDYAAKELKYLKPEDYEKNNIEVGTLLKASIFFKPIKEFYKLKLTKENFEEEKLKWIKSRGNEK